MSQKDLGLTKGEEEEEEETTDEDSEESEEETEQMDDDTNKADVALDDLRKSLDDYAVVEDALADGDDRETYLKARYDNGTITKSEQGELAKLWLGEDADTDRRPQSLRKSLADSLDDDERDLVDASDFLKSLTDSLNDQLDDVAREIGRNGHATRNLLKSQGAVIAALGQVVIDQGDMIKSLSGRVEDVEGTPRQPRAVRTDAGSGVERPLAKSDLGDGGDPNANALNKSQIAQGLRSMLIKAVDADDEHAIQRINLATAKFENARVIDRQTEQAIRAELNS